MLNDLLYYNDIIKCQLKTNTPRLQASWVKAANWQDVTTYVKNTEHIKILSMPLRTHRPMLSFTGFRPPHLNFESPYLETYVTCFCTIKFWTNFIFTIKLYIQYLMRYNVFKQVKVDGFRPQHLNCESPYLETYVTCLYTIKFWKNFICTVKLYIQYLMRYNAFKQVEVDGFRPQHLNFESHYLETYVTCLYTIKFWTNLIFTVKLYIQYLMRYNVFKQVEVDGFRPPHLNFDSPYLETYVTCLYTIKFWTNLIFTIKLYIQYLMRYNVFKQVEVDGFRPPHLNFESPYLETYVTWLCTIKFWTNFIFTIKPYIQYLMRYNVFKQVEVGGFRPPHLNFESPYLETYVTCFVHN